LELERLDLDYFVRLTLFDETSRPPTGKRQTQGMGSFWMSRPREQSMRGSDITARRNVCIEELKTVGGASVAAAAAQVATILGKSTRAEVDAIRTGYYQRGVDEASRKLFWGTFLMSREQILASTEKELAFLLNQYEDGCGTDRRHSLQRLFEDLRADEVQAARNRSWALERCQIAQARIESNQWDPDADWKSLATDHSEVGRFRAAFGQAEEATNHLNQALEIWKAHGQEMPHIQARAVSQLEAAIARLQS